MSPTPVTPVRLTTAEKARAEVIAEDAGAAGIVGGIRVALLGEEKRRRLRAKTAERTQLRTERRTPPKA